MQDPGHWLCLVQEENPAASLTKAPVQQTLSWCPRLCCLGHSSYAKKADKLAAAYYFDIGRKKKKEKIWFLCIHFFQMKRGVAARCGKGEAEPQALVAAFPGR